MRATLFVFLWLIGVALPVCSDEVTIRADLWFPYNGDPKSTQPGFMIEIAQEALATKNIKVNYETMPWERALALTREGKIDCVAGAAFTDAPDFVYPTEAQGHIQNYFYVKNGNPWRYAGLESLGNIKLGVIDGYSYDDDIDKYIEQNKKSGKIQSIGGDTPLEQNLKKLLAGRVDAILESGPVLQAKLVELKLIGKVSEAGTAGEPDNLFIACSPNQSKSVDITKALAEGTAQLRSSGKLKAILAKYGVSDWK